MSFELIAFYAFAFVTVAAALAVVSVRNPVHAALFLVLTFFSSACVWLLAEAEFLAIALILVYVGAVMVLFLFVVMMLDIKVDPLREGFARYLPVAIVVAVVMALEMFVLIGRERMQQGLAAAGPALPDGVSNTEWLGRAMFTQYLLPFELAAVILTVAIVAAIAITLRRRVGTRHQDPSRQVMVRSEDRVRLVKMAAETKERAP
jgi:NADH-quinone oxidoreductase subunit J